MLYEAINFQICFSLIFGNDLIVGYNSYSWSPTNWNKKSTNLGLKEKKQLQANSNVANPGSRT